MKKIININLSGRVIPIEDAAFESLQAYIESLRRYFMHEEGRDEIINDIESRIAELMNDKIKTGKSAITEDDMEEIISSMGRIEDFEEVDAAEPMGATGATGGATFTETKERERFKGRLYRDSSDKILGGVCAGIANYMKVDPAIIRLLFAIITFGGFGFGIFIYILLWIILPARDLEDFVGKRLFRNPEDRVIGGVAGGLAAYFNKDTWVIRLIFAAPLILNILVSVLNGIFNMHGPYFGAPDIFFGSFTGTFFLAYIILWIVLPEAKSPFEKMEMRGEKVDVNRIRQNVKDGMGDFKTRAQAWGEEVKTSAHNLGNRASEFANTRGKTFATEVSNTARSSGIGHAIGVLIKAFFIFIAGSIAFALFVALIILIFGGGTAFWPLKQNLLNLALDGFWQQAFFWGTVIFFFLIPLIAFITWMVRRLMKVRSQRSYLGWIFGGLWVLGFICLMLLVSSIVRDFRSSRTVTEQVAVGGVSNKLVVMVNEPEVRHEGDWFTTDSENMGWSLTDDSLRLGNVKIKVLRSPDSSYSVTLVKESRGRNGNEAKRRASRISYSINQMDSILNLGSGFSIAQDDKFRAQEVEVEIYVPVGKQIEFHHSVEEKLHPVNIKISDRRRERDRDFETDDYDRFPYKTNVVYTMTATGELVDINSPAPQTRSTDTSVYEYRRTDTASINQQIEEQRRRAEEEQRKLRELEQKRTEGTTKASKIKVDKRSFTSTTAAQINSPIFSLIAI